MAGLTLPNRRIEAGDVDDGEYPPNRRRTAGGGAGCSANSYLYNTYIGRFQALSAMHVYTHFNTKERGGKNVLVSITFTD